MLRKHAGQRRRGAHVVECAIVYPVVMLLLIGIMVFAWEVFRYQQLAWLAREGARYASVRGWDYSQDTTANESTSRKAFNINGYSAVSTTDVETYLKSLAEPYLANKISVATTWNTTNATYQETSDNGQARVNTVSVQVTYTWTLDAGLLRNIIGVSVPMSSTSVMPMSF